MINNYKRNNYSQRTYGYNTRLIALVLVFTIILSSVFTGGLSASAETVNNAVASENTETVVPEEPYIIGEDTERRGENEKHFLMSDGTRVATMYDTAVHYLDESGKYQEIDNSFESTENDEYQTKKGKNKVKLAKKASAKKLVTLHTDDYKISWGFEGAEKVKAQIVEDNNETDVDFAVKNVNGKMKYVDAFENVDLEYIVKPDGIKENIILKSADAQKEFIINYDVGKLVAVQKDSRTIELIDGETVKYTISAPVVIDANNEMSADLSITLTEQKNGKLTVILSADSDWISATEREYPVIVDPILEPNTNASILNYSTAIDGTTSNLNGFDFSQCTYSGSKEDGGHFTSLYKITTLPSLPAGSYVSTADFFILGEISTSGSLNVSLYEVVEQWTAESNHILNYEPELAQYETSCCLSENLFQFDITILAKKWYEKPGDNVGFALKGGYYNYITFASPAYSLTSSRPILQIGYISHIGLEDYLSYTEIGMDSATAYVNNATGNLTVAMPIVATVGQNMPTDFQLYYNTVESSVFAPIKSGYGWRSNFDQQITEITDSKLLEQGYKYIYTDGDGTKHYMFLNKDTNEYTDETGMGLTVTKNSNGYTLKSKNKDEYTFNTSGKLTNIKSINSTSSISITYSNGMISKITDGSGDSITITRNSNGTIKNLTDPYSRNISFAYTGNNLSKITFYDNNAINIIYENNLLVKFYSIEGYKTLITYKSTTSNNVANKVSNIASYSKEDSNGDSDDGGSYDFSYSYEGYSIVSDPLKNEYTYIFDEYGRANNGFNELGASAIGYNATTKSEPNKNNKVVKEAYSEAPAENLLSNSSFESSSDWWSWTADSQSTSSLYTKNGTDDKNVKLGNKSLKLSSASTSSGVTYFQVYYPKVSGKYTYSVYYNTGTAGLEGSGVNLLIALENKNGDVTYVTSPQVTTNTKEKWLRLSVTADVDVSVIEEIRLTNSLRNTIGTVYFDCAQLEIGETPSEYNMLSNPFFNKGETVWNGIKDNLVIPASLANELYDDTRPIELYPQVCELKNNYPIEQTININLPASQALLNFSAFALAIITEPKNGGVQLEVTFKFADGTTETQVVRKFNPYNRIWQNCMGVATPSIRKNSDGSDKIVNTVTARVIVKDSSLAFVTGVKFCFDTSLKQYSYDTKGNFDTATYSSDICISSKHDDENRLTKQTMYDGAKYEYTYVGDTNLVYEIKGPLVKDENTNYGDLFNSEQITAQFQETKNTYNCYGQLTSTERYNSVITNKKITSSSEYSDEGKYLLSTTNEIGTETENRYAAYDNLQKVIFDTANTENSVNYTYDTSDRIKTVSQKRNSANTSTVQYNYSNNQLSSINHNGFNYSFNYNNFGSILSTKVGNKTLITNTYGENDYNQSNNVAQLPEYLIKSTYGNGDYIEYDYDKYGRVVAEKVNGTITFKYTYTTGGRLYMTKDVQNGIKYFYFYDELGRLNDIQISYTTASATSASRINVIYDSANKITQRAYTFKGETKNAKYKYLKGGLPQLSQLFGYASTQYSCDNLARVGSLRIAPYLAEDAWIASYEYYNPTQTTSSHLVSKVTHRSEIYGTQYDIDYTYDKFGNIKTTDNEFNSSNTSYEYDYLNQLTRDNNSKSGKTTTYNYDNGGNILSKTTYDYTTGSLDGLTGTVVQYTYGDSNWKDKLTAYNGNTITYDAIGNPINYYNGTTFEWDNGRQLARATKTDGTYMSYRYDDSGVRIRKSVNGVSTDYFVDGSTIVAEKTGNNLVWYYYDAAGLRVGFTYNNIPYYYIYNAQGDVIGLFNVSQQIVARYNYDAWGKIVSVTDGTGAEITDTTHIAHVNPFRYRGYYYDTETGLYYVSSRYYDPEIGRWINTDDAITGTGGDILGYNMFSYCFNNPVNMTDSSGHWPQWIKDVADWVNDKVIQPVVNFVKDIVEDINNFDLNNESEEKVLESNYFSSYKGVPVIRTNGDRSGSFGAIFLTRETNNRSNPEDVIRHEYGHTKQLEQLGIVNYALCIGLPSWQQWGTGEYYSKPWEITADIYGGVQSRNHSQSNIDRGFAYLEGSKIIGPLIWMFIE